LVSPGAAFTPEGGRAGAKDMAVIPPPPATGSQGAARVPVLRPYCPGPHPGGRIRAAWQQASSEQLPSLLAPGQGPSQVASHTTRRRS